LTQERELKERGYILFSSDSEKSMLDVAECLGQIFRVSSMPLVQTLTPRLKEDEYENTYSGNYGLNEFPFHTDLAHWYIPPRYLLLRCVCPANNVATKLIDSNVFLENISADLFNRSHFKPRKCLDRKVNLLKILHGGIFRWDSIFIEPVNKTAKLLKIHIEEHINSMQSDNLVLENIGDCLLIDNWRMLHGRDAINRESMGRKIERVYFNEVII
jgi:L-asparagine oxygenase